MRTLTRSCCLLAAALLLTGCSGKEEGTAPAETHEKPITAYHTPKGEIMTISGHLNYAWGYTHYGRFADTIGNVYLFSIAGLNTYDLEQIELEVPEKLELIRCYSAPVDSIGKAQANELVELGSQVDAEADRTERSMGSDYGTDYIRYRDPETGELKVCASSGDTDVTIHDAYANKLERRWNEMMEAVEPDLNVRPVIYPMLACEEAEIPKGDSKASGKYILFSDDQLRDLAETTGLPVDGVLDRMEQSEYWEQMREKYVYFVDLSGSARADALMQRGGTFEFVHFKKQRENYAHVTVLDKEAVDFTRMNYYDHTGKEWRLPRENDPNADEATLRSYAEGLNDEAAGKLYETYGCNKSRGLLIQDAAAYEELIEQCDSLGLTKKGSVRDLLEQDGAPGFADHVLCVRIDRRTEGSTYQTGRIMTTSDHIRIGISLTEPKQGQTGDSGLVWLWLPRCYLPEGNAGVVRVS